MSDKSFVTMEQHICPVCGKEHSTGALLFDRRLRNLFDRTTTTGTSLCEEHQKLYCDGYIALVEVDETKSAPSNNAIKPENAYRTGNTAYVRVEVFCNLFNMDTPTKDDVILPMVFVGQGVVDKLKELMANA